MTLTIALGSAGSAGSPSPEAVANAAFAPTAAVERTVASVNRPAPEDYHASIWQWQATPVPGVAEPANPIDAPPQEMRLEASSRSGDRAPVPTPSGATESQVRFIMAAVGPAQASQRATGVPASVTLAQAALESDWGRSALATKGNNYFGIKAQNGPGPAGVIWMSTAEYLNGKRIVVNAGFKAYNNMEESFTDHGRFLTENSRYRQCLETKDPKEFARRLQAAGYATDPDYAAKLIRFMDKFNLYAYDLP